MSNIINLEFVENVAHLTIYKLISFVSESSFSKLQSDGGIVRLLIILPNHYDRDPSSCVTKVFTQRQA